MATSRPFAYNPGSILSGTEQFGTIAVGVDPNNRYDENYGGLQWWNGPDEELGFCIGTSVPSEGQPTPIGNTGNVGFWRTNGFNDQEFISLSNTLTQQNFTNGNEAKLWLNDNGYWTSYDSSVVTPTPTPSVTPTITPTSSEVPVTPTNTPTPTLTETPTSTPTPTSSEVPITPTVTETPTNTPTPTGTPTETPTNTPTPTITPSQTCEEFDLVNQRWINSGSISLTCPNLGSNKWRRNDVSAESITNLNISTEPITQQFLKNYQPFFASLTVGDVIRIQNYPNPNTGWADFEITASPTFHPFGGVPQYCFPVTLKTNNGWDEQIGDNGPSGTTINFFNSVDVQYTTYNTCIPTPTGMPAETPTPTPSSTSGPTPSGFTVNIYESGSDVIMSASGSLNINDLSQVATGGSLGNEGLIVPVAPVFIMSPVTPPFGQFDAYSGFTSGPTNLGTGGFNPASSFIGDVFAIVTDSGNFQLFVPVGYESSDSISSTQTFVGQSFASLGLVEGTYTYTWGSGANAEVVNVVVGGTPPPPPPSSGLTVTVQEIGPNVVWSGSGSLDLSALSIESTQQISAGFAGNGAIWIVGPANQENLDLYGGFAFDTYPTVIGSGGDGADSGTGDLFGVLDGSFGRTIAVPVGYVYGSPLNATTTYLNTTISSIGLTPGTYTYSWGNGVGESITLIVG